MAQLTSLKSASDKGPCYHDLQVGRTFRDMLKESQWRLCSGKISFLLCNHLFMMINKQLFETEGPTIWHYKYFQIFTVHNLSHIYSKLPT